MRTSAHKLLIETGRYTNIPRNETRICKNCTNQEIEDETHFLTRCPKFSGERDALFNSTSAKVKNFTNLSDKINYFGCWIVKIRRS